MMFHIVFTSNIYREIGKDRVRANQTKLMMKSNRIYWVLPTRFKSSSNSNKTFFWHLSSLFYTIHYITTLNFLKSCETTEFYKCHLENWLIIAIVEWEISRNLHSHTLFLFFFFLCFFVHPFKPPFYIFLYRHLMKMRKCITAPPESASKAAAGELVYVCCSISSWLYLANPLNKNPLCLRFPKSKYASDRINVAMICW